MHMSVKIVVAAVVVGLSLPLVVRGDEGGGWKMPNLNPFSRKGAPPTSARITDDTSWKMPNLLPTTTTKTTAPKSYSNKPKAQAPSTWQKMTTGTKTVFAKTADALNPFDDANDNKPVRVTGSKNAFRQASAKKKAESSSWLPSLWKPQEEKRPTSVNDFLSQPRPQP